MKYLCVVYYTDSFFTYMLVLCPEYQTHKNIVECGFSVQNTLRDHLLLSRLLCGIQL